MHLPGWWRRLRHRQKRRGDMLVGEKWQREQGYCKGSPRPHHLQYWRNKTLLLTLRLANPSRLGLRIAIQLRAADRDADDVAFLLR